MKQLRTLASTLALALTAAPALAETATITDIAGRQVQVETRSGG